MGHSRPIQLCQLCLSFYQRPNISDRFVNFSFSFYPCSNIPDTFVGDEMNSCQSCSALFHKRGTHFILKTNTTHRKWKWTVKSGIWPPRSIQKKTRDICRIFFSDFRCIFFALGGICDKSSKSKYHSIHQSEFFDTRFVCHKHPLQVFCFFPLLACFFFHFLIFGELSKLRAKFFMC